MEIVNLTPHKINVVSETTVSFPPSGKVARVTQNLLEVENENGIPIFTEKLGEVENLPQAKDGVMFIVSVMVRTACPHRTDVVSPGKMIRNSEGQPIGCEGLIKNS
jgi:hypothetical protein